MVVGFGKEEEQEGKQGLESLIEHAIKEGKALRLCFPNTVVRIIPKHYNKRTGELSGSILTKVLSSEGENEKLVKVPGVIYLQGIQVAELQIREDIERDFQMIYSIRQYIGKQATAILKKEHLRINGVIVGIVGDYIHIKKGNRVYIVPQSEVHYWEIKE